jgi:peptide-methionine (R)-S-oxide reductase
MRVVLLIVPTSLFLFDARGVRGFTTTTQHGEGRVMASTSISATSTRLFMANDSQKNPGGVRDKNRRILWGKKAIQVASVTIGLTALTSLTRPVWAAASKSRTDGYAVQKTEAEWKAKMSPLQYKILRQGGTELPGFSVLETEKRGGSFRCAGCGTPLFDTRDKFTSGTGWPSFARGLPGVETEAINPLLAGLSGAELRCATCGGHLGDVFQDGFLFVGTEAAKTGKRFCIDGAALVFYPGGDDSESKPIRGDTPAAATKALPSWLEPPKISPKE